MLTPSPEIRGEQSIECDAPVTDRGGNIAAVRISVFSLAVPKSVRDMTFLTWLDTTVWNLDMCGEAGSKAWYRKEVSISEAAVLPITPCQPRNPRPQLKILNPEPQPVLLYRYCLLGICRCCSGRALAQSVDSDPVGP